MLVVDTLSRALLGRRERHEGQRNGNGEGNDLRDDDEFEVDGETGGHDVGDRLMVQVGLTEVAVEDRTQPHEVLLVERFVQSQLLEEHGPVVGCVVGTEDDHRRIAREQVHQQEAQDRDDERHHHQLEESADEIGGHGGLGRRGGGPSAYPFNQIWVGTKMPSSKA